MKTVLVGVLVWCAIAFGRPLVIGHRGAPTTAPENTMPSFVSAVTAEIDGVETDLRMTLDGVIVLMHDANVARTTNGTGLVRNMTYAQIETLDAGSWFGKQVTRCKSGFSSFSCLKVHLKFAGTKVPRLEDLFLFLSTSTSYFVVMDLKEEAIPEFADEVARVVKVCLGKGVFFFFFFFFFAKN
jgi:glycerophosphoryl diester phosphodiesterase